MAIPPPEAACATCIYFDSFAHDRGVCRVHPPVVNAMDNRAVWPVVGLTDWCGEYVSVEASIKAAIEATARAAAAP